MRINENYLVCQMLDEVYLIPKGWNKSDQSVIKRMVGSGGDIVLEIYEHQGIALDELMNRLYDMYQVEETMRESIARQIEKFIDQGKMDDLIWE